MESGQKLFLKAIPFPKEEEWKYIRVMYGSRGNQSDDACTNQVDCICQHLVISPKTDLETWWKKLSELISTKTQALQSHKDIRTSIQICKFLLHQLFQQEQCITLNDITKDSEINIEAFCMSKSEKEICFLTRIQFSIFHDHSAKKVDFSSPYGTGKTTLLKAKAKELANKAIEEELENKTTEMELENRPEDPQNLSKKGYHVVIVLFDDQKATNNFLLKASYDLEFRSFKKVKIFVLKETGKIF